ncbi:MAG: cysteine--tRNA ligase [Candidatus Moranbacteria bacterium]|nr:cysteine--tRNA ligase [Candidatus Moranbacteria bacterium]
MLRIYNTLTKQKEIFEPLYPGKVGMYTCGPTVYGKIHIGNLRAYLLGDMIRRYFEYAGYEVRAIKNITDVGHLTDDDVAQGDSGDDKMIKQALKEHKTPQEIAQFYEEYFHVTEKQINILPAHYFPRATAHIPQMIKLIEELITKGHAYEKNGNVFLDVTTFPEYGRLSGNTLDKLKVGARLEEHPDKKNPWDFALWLKAPKNHLMKWESPWSLGYPGWHIECSAMSMEYLGDTFDIHTGGEDNIFPHHEAEIVQSEGVTEKPFARYWLHVRHLLADGVKMSKSKGNLYTLEDILDKGYSAMDVRFLLLSSHYRSQMNFTWEAMDQARSNRETLQNFHDRLTECHPEPVEGSFRSEQDASTTLGMTQDKISLDTEKYRADFDAALEEDFNTPQALTVLFDMTKNGNKLIDEDRLDNPTDVLKFLETSAAVLGLQWTKKEAIPEHIQKLAADREEARKQRNFARSDELREEIEKAGFSIEDTAQGAKLKRI